MSNWKYTKIHRLEIQALANASSRTTNGKKISTALGGNSIALYINLRGRAYFTNIGRLKFLVFASQEGLATDLGWVLEETPQRITNAIRPLIQAGFITRYIPEDKSDEAKEIRKIIGWKYEYNRTNIYELILFKEIYYQGHFRKKTKIKTKGKAKPPSLPFSSGDRRNLITQVLSGDYRPELLPFTGDVPSIQETCKPKPPVLRSETPSFGLDKGGVCYTKDKEENFTIKPNKKSYIDMNKTDEDKSYDVPSKDDVPSRNLYKEFRNIAFRVGNNPMGFANWEDRTNEEVVKMIAYIQYFDMNDWYYFLQERAEYEIALDQETMDWIDKRTDSIMQDRQV